jgi:hypothetical protein
MKVFWSWQSDRPAKYCRNVIQDALGRALTALSDELELDPSEGPELTSIFCRQRLARSGLRRRSRETAPSDN